MGATAFFHYFEFFPDNFWFGFIIGAFFIGDDSVFAVGAVAELATAFLISFSFV